MTEIELAYGSTEDTTELRNELVLSELSQVYYTARRIRERLPQHVELEELVQAGVLGLIDAAAKYDATKEVKFSTFAKFRINGAILDSLRELDWGSRTLRRKARAIDQASAKIGFEVGRAATQDEIAADLGMTTQKLQDTVTQLYSLQIVGQIAVATDGSGVCQDLIEAAPNRGDDDPFTLCLAGENRALLITALELLSDREQKVIQLYYEEGLTMREIGVVLNLAVTRISQIHTECILKMRRVMDQSKRPKPSMTAMPMMTQKDFKTATSMRPA